MIHYIDYQNIPTFPDCVACIGYFDGIHLGHQQLIKETVRISRITGLKAILITFYPDPWVVLRNLENVAHLTSMEDRERIAENMGIDDVYCLNFTKEFANLEIDEFIQKVIISLNVKELVCGFDFTFGRFGKGTPEDLLKYNEFATHVIDSINHQEKKISSTRIEELLSLGNIDLVKSLLGRYYWINGVIVHGRKVGASIDFPTANLKTTIEYVMPKNGVYLTIFQIGERLLPAITNIGHNSAFNHYQDISIETHILDFSENIYEKKARIYFVDFLREEKEFSSLEELKQQLNIDKRSAQDYFSKYLEDMVLLIKEDSNYVKEILITK